MALTVLVSGVLEYDSGKTWLSIGLGLVGKRRGLSVGMYKPVAGHSFWNKFSSIIESKKRGIMLGNDVLMYEEYLGALDNPGLVNPVDLLVAYPDPLVLRGFSEYMLSVSSLEKSLVMARVTRCTNKADTRHYVFVENLSLVPSAARQRLVELARLLGAEKSDAKSFLGFLASSEASTLLEECRERISTGKDVVIIESFSDSLLPYSGVENSVDFLVLVAPGKALVFTGEKLRQAIELLGDRSIRSSSLLSVARYSAYIVADVPPASSPRELSESLEKSEIARIIA